MRAPESRITSGIRNEPPISTSWPRETMTSRALAQGCEREQDRGRVVVDDVRGLGLEKRRQERGQQVGALAALARFEVQLEVAVAGGDGERVHGGTRQRGASEVGVQDHAGGVDHSPQPRRRGQLQAFLDAADPVGIGGLLAVALGLDLVADGVDHALASEAGGQRRVWVGSLISVPTAGRDAAR